MWSQAPPQDAWLVLAKDGFLSPHNSSPELETLGGGERKIGNMIKIQVGHGPDVSRWLPHGRWSGRAPPAPHAGNPPGPRSTLRRAAFAAAAAASALTGMSASRAGPEGRKILCRLADKRLA